MNIESEQAQVEHVLIIGGVVVAMAAQIDVGIVVAENIGQAYFTPVFRTQTGVEFGHNPAAQSYSGFERERTSTREGVSPVDLHGSHFLGVETSAHIDFKRGFLAHKCFRFFG